MTSSHMIVCKQVWVSVIESIYFKTDIIISHAARVKNWVTLTVTRMVY